MRIISIPLVVLLFISGLTGCGEKRQFSYEDYDPGPYDFTLSMSDTALQSPFVRDTLSRLDRFAADTLLLAPDTTGPLAFLTVGAIATSPSGRVAVTDRLGHTLSLHSFENPDPLWVGGQGDGPSEFNSPSGVALLTDDSRVVVHDGARGLRFFDIQSDTLQFTFAQQETGIRELGTCGDGLVTLRHYGGRPGESPELVQIRRADGTIRRSAFPGWAGSSHPLIPGIVNRAHVACSPDGARVAVVKRRSPVVYILNGRTGVTLRTIHVSERTFQMILDVSSDDGISADGEDLNTYDLSTQLISVDNRFLLYEFNRRNRTEDTADEGFYYVLIDWKTGRAEPIGRLPNIVGSTKDGLVSFAMLHDHPALVLHRF